MNILIVEDDSVSSLLLKTVLSHYGTCRVAEDGKLALQFFREAIAEKKPYDLVCLDIMLPGLDGRDVLKQIRAIEDTYGIAGLDGVKIIMITALSDNRTIMEAFRSQCEAYILKPIRKEKVIDQLVSLGLIGTAVLSQTS